MEGWVSTEIGNVDFNDKRLKDRLILLTKQLSSKPTASIPEACEGWADTKAAYRFFDNPKVTPDKIRDIHYNSTIDRLKEKDTIIIVQDTTHIDFSTHYKTKGLGVLSAGWRRGLKLHSAMAVTLDGVPRGLIHQEVSAREYIGARNDSQLTKRDIKEKESYRWLNTVEKVASRLPNDKQAIVIGDRESDIYQLFTMPRRPGIDLLVRVAQNREVKDEGKRLFTAIDRSNCQGTIKVTINRAFNQKSRDVMLEVRYLTLEFIPPHRGYNYNRNFNPVSLNVVEAKENNPPSGEERVHWKLLTTLPVDSFEAAVNIIKLYSYRWLIERYHYTLKSGCKVEDLQLENGERLTKALAVYSVVAWRVLWMTYEMRVNPEAPCTVILELNEWKALACFKNKISDPLGKLPTLQEATIEIAKLGGFLGRKGDKNPGVKTIWRGLRRLEDIVIMWQKMGGQ